MTLYVTFNSPVDTASIDNDRILLASVVGELESLNAICEQLSVKSLADFQSYDPSDLAEFIDDPEERAALVANAAPIEWFDASQALPTVQKLHNYFARYGFMHSQRSKPAGERKWIVESVDKTTEILKELRDLELMLSLAAKTGAKFRLHIGD